jgi:hypothetical protein
MQKNSLLSSFISNQTGTCIDGFGWNSDASLCVKPTIMALDCKSKTAVAKWYKEYIGRCADTAGMNYWQSTIPGQGEAAAYASFKAAVAASPNEKSLDAMLCPKETTYVKNTSFCKPLNGDGIVKPGTGSIAPICPVFMMSPRPEGDCTFVENPPNANGCATGGKWSCSGTGSIAPICPVFMMSPRPEGDCKFIENPPNANGCATGGKWECKKICPMYSMAMPPEGCTYGPSVPDADGCSKPGPLVCTGTGANCPLMSQPMPPPYQE